MSWKGTGSKAETKQKSIGDVKVSIEHTDWSDFGLRKIEEWGKRISRWQACFRITQLVEDRVRKGLKGFNASSW